ncbi:MULTISPECIES: response regulator transcription factor [Ralstonia]|uniref:Sensory transduction protein regX3 n=1 Tax=Ralstonia mannitolilytica TaxID=105219 RepID=A0AAJ4ZJ10_9RALS|nr:MULTISPECIES: response regulator transcription factor [Ralstonia]AJW44275.1 transcriptional regulator [Ralstonia mannitolilytica]PLT17205.1 DNA-binding response regulator [Ralstonia mannitolilytica]QIF06637.1 response regulator transcription factor [Ralstonia mannitolilytica]CAG2142639.1 Sensory transduction protein regX3 [Ralstonia mannitolilytica]CAJ0730563.1 Sensory transduction protein regX3 [Ralstonia mannitolilytica]
MRIALLEDDPFQSEVIVQILSQSDHEVVTYTDGTTLLRMLGRCSYDMLILDWHTPGMLGIDVLSVVRGRHKEVLPILFVTAEEDEKSLVRALTQGADDYIAKPFRISELRARVDALLRRAYPIPYGRLPFELGPYHFNPQRQQVTLHGQPVALTAIEFQLALLLFSNVGRTLSRDHIFGQVWGRNSSEYTRTIDSHVSRIRMKLNIEPTNEVRLVAVYKHGYRVDHLKAAEGFGTMADIGVEAYDA